MVVQAAFGEGEGLLNTANCFIPTLRLLGPASTLLVLHDDLNARSSSMSLPHSDYDPVVSA
jgi:hypothetical protein